MYGEVRAEWVFSVPLNNANSLQRGHTSTIAIRLAEILRRLREPSHRHGRSLRQHRHHQTRTRHLSHPLPTQIRAHQLKVSHAASLRPDTTFCRNVVRPAVSVEEQQPSFNSLVGGFLPLPDDPPAPNYLEDASAHHLDAFAFSHGAFDPSFNGPLDFSFDDFINDPATVAIDSGAGAAV